MSLKAALALLSDVHTVDDEMTGFKIHYGSPELGKWHKASYFEAWAVVRDFITAPGEQGEAR